MARRGLGFAATLMLIALGAPGALAATASVTIDKADPPLQDAGDKGFTAALGFTNLTDRSVTLEAVARNDDSCAPTLDKPDIAPGHHQAMTLTIPPACDVPEDGGFDFAVRSVSGADPPVAFDDLTAAPKPGSKPNWEPLLVFPVALLAALAFVFVVFGAWRNGDASRRPGSLLGHLDDDFDFKDSWVTNVTAAAAIVSGVFASSEVLTAVLGEDAKDAMGLAIVGGAIALGFTGAGPLVVAGSRDQESGDIPVWGLLLAAAVTLAGAYGQIWVLWQFASKLGLDGADAWATIAAVLAALLLGWYALRSLRYLLTSGTTPPTPRAVPGTDVSVPARRRAAVL